MHFKRLRLAGFKSFVEPTELWIEPGLTGVVGPNGCGKSNLLEALRWVMGESRPKSLRGGGMEDVIFAGTDQRSKRNLADVTLLIDNSSRTAPAQFNDSADLEVSRRIERDLGSLYRINGRDVRQKDVQLLFADAATGATSPALVSQGRVGALINAKPQDRRKLLEDAAGISGLHTRRKEAEQKLKAAATNLERLDDVLMRMDAQANALRRQAKQAVRYRTLSELIRQLEAQLFYARWQRQAALLEAARTALAQADTNVATKTGLASKSASAQAHAAALLPDLRQAEVEAGSALSRLQLQAQNLEAEYDRLEALKADLTRRREEADKDAHRQADYAADAQGALARLVGDMERLKTAISSDAATTRKYQDTLDAAQAEAALAEQQFEQETKAIASAAAHARSARQGLETARTAVEQAQRGLEQQNTAHAELEAEASADSALNDAQTQLQNAETTAGEAQLALTAAEETQDAAQINLRDAQSAADAASAALKQLDSEIAGTQAALDADAQLQAGTPLGDILDIERGLELALGAALGDGLELPLDTGVRHWLAAPERADDPALPRGLVPLSQYVSGAAHVGRRLNQTGVAEDAAAAQEAAADLKPGQQIVTREGALWRWDGLRASAEAPSRASLRLRQRNHLTALGNQRPTLEDKCARAADALVTCTSAHESALAQRSAARQALDEAIRAAQHTRSTLRNVEHRAQALIEKRSASAARLEARTEALSTAKRALSDAHSVVDALPDLTAQQRALDTQRDVVATKRSALSDARAGYDSQVAAARGREAAYQRARSERKMWLERTEKARDQAETLQARQREITQALKELAARPGEIKAQQSQLLDQMAEREHKRGAAADALAAKEAEVAEHQRALHAAQEAASQAREERARIAAQTESLEAQREELIEACQTTFERAPSAVLDLCGVSDASDIPALDEISADMEKRKLERERLGAVNLRADLELQELEEEAATLRAEQAELQSAIAQLRGAIGSLNREGRSRLMAAFDAVNAHFGKLFTTLFGGGAAHITLIESDDPLEAGLEIMASPPGKKLQSLSLLSGGEQALTALSLIFAVFLTNPAPICVLDEVDAPLDDVNVERFCGLLDEMVAITQTRFLIVTHNALTMSRMHRLFGVTMAERGVSQLVSVDLSQAETLVAAE
ncbi:MAG: AAA family ATPase [Pseudomonadota bacterium]